MIAGSSIGKMKFLSVLPALLGFMASVMAQVPSGGLIASYPFNNNANDESGNNNHATSYLVKFSTDRCGFANTACYFNGTDNSITLPAASFIHFNEYTYSCWFEVSVFPAAASGWTMLSVGSGSGKYQQSLSVLSDGSLLGTSYYSGDDLSVTYAQTTPVQTGRWIHAVMIRDNASLSLWLNGQPIASVETHNQPAYYGADDVAAMIGCNLTKDSYYMGSIDDVMIYDRALSADEVLQLYYSKCTLSEIEGPTDVCQGQQQVSYSLYSLYGSATYQWEYSGNGATIHGNGNNITVDFAGNASGGTLSVTVSGIGSGEQQRSIQVSVLSLPQAPGPITGTNEVCTGQQGVSYSVPPVQGATAYNWQYDGSDVSLVELPGNEELSNTIIINFDDNFASGNLTVTATNACGNGPASEPYPVTILSLPAAAGTISGEKTVCSGRQGIAYSVPVIPQATGYSWDYSGTGATVSGNSNSITVDFSADATGGSLTVKGQNTCGAGIPSPGFLVSVNPCIEEPVISVPNSFSPNGDGINEVFMIRGLTENSSLMIFNRAGTLLYHTENYSNDWNGTDSQGNPLSSGTYWYVLSVPEIQHAFKGYVYLRN